MVLERVVSARGNALGFTPVVYKKEKAITDPDVTRGCSIVCAHNKDHIQSRCVASKLRTSFLWYHICGKKVRFRKFTSLCVMRIPGRWQRALTGDGNLEIVIVIGCHSCF